MAPKSQDDDEDLPSLSSLSLTSPDEAMPAPPPPPKRMRTLLPSPLASAVSLFTTTSSYTLRVGGLVGDFALYGAKIGTLTGFEVGRAVLEGILGRAGQDIVQVSRGEIGRAAAESLLERALMSLHEIITQSSFLVSAGFQIGSTSINTSMAIGQTFLSALNTVFGDTETSKAIATIIILVQREINADNRGRKGDKLSLSDVLTGVVAFALLQNWGRKRTMLEQEESGAFQVIWDVVVMADTKEDALQLAPRRNGVNALHASSPQDEAARPRPASSASFMSALGGAEDFEGLAADDNRSFVSLASSRPAHDRQADGQLDASFREHIVSQLKPGTNVKVTMQSMTINSITVEVEGDDHTLLEPPQGYSLVSADESKANKRKLTFQSRSKRRKSGNFEVQKPVPERGSSLRLAAPPSPVATEAAPMPPPKDVEWTPDMSHLQPMANQKRQRTSLAPLGESKIPVPSASPPREESPRNTGERLKDSIKRKKSYQNLVDMLNTGQSKRKASERDSRNMPANLPLRSSAHAAPSRPISPAMSRNPSTRTPITPTYSRPASPAMSRITQGEPATFQTPTAENLAALDARDRPGSRISHHRRPSSIYSLMTATSETSMVLHNNGKDDSISEYIATSLRRNGTLPGQYPQGKFAENAMRYLRFAHAAYGASFLRILGNVAKEDNPAYPSSAHHKEHQSFSSYTRLPPSTVLLSSWVDPKGVPLGKSSTDAATVLVHYVSLDHEAKAVVLSCRGTLGFEDILTDLTADYEDFEWQNEVYSVHSGIYAAARKLLSSNDGRVMATLKTALEEFTDYGLVFCGHSLGAAVASVLATMISEPNTSSLFGPSAFITSLQPERRRYIGNGSDLGPACIPEFTIPPGRPIHVYSYGAAASVSPALQRATRGLTTSIIHGQDLVPWLSLGVLRDFQAVALAFKIDKGDAKAEVRRRVWEGLQKAFRDSTGFGNQWLSTEADPEEDQWPWVALQGLRSNLNALKLVPAGEVFHIEARPVLQRHAFVSRSKRRAQDTRSFKPATRVTLTHVVDIEQKFKEIGFGTSMWLDHIPMRYETVLETLERGLG